MNINAIPMHYYSYQLKSQNKKSVLRIIAASCLFMLAAVFLFTLFTNTVHAADDLTGISYAAKTGLSGQDIRLTIAKVIRIVLGFLGIIAVSLILYAGWMWMSSQGNEEKITAAKKILKNAIIGLAIILSAFAIVSFIINRFLGIAGNNNGGSNSPGRRHGGIGALGAGIIKSVYPEPDQLDVPRNTSIIVTFREKMSASTICDSLVDGADGTKHCAENAHIIARNVRIFETDKNDACGSEGETCTNGNIINVRVFSNDNETFVFVPVNYLGSSDKKIWHSVYLSGSIKKADGADAFGGLENDYEWSFEVSTKIDLTPPQVQKGGVFPSPDNQKDEVGAIEAGVQAQAAVDVKSLPRIASPGQADSPVPAGNSDRAKLEGSYNCQDNGIITVSISGNSNQANVSGVKGVVSGDSTVDKAVNLGCGLVLKQINDGVFTPGNSWTIGVHAEIYPSTLTIANRTYTFGAQGGGGANVERGGTVNAAASNLASALNSNPQVSASVSGARVIIKSRNADANGNNIAVYSNDNNILAVSPFTGGRDRGEVSVKKDKSDKPRNAVIQVVFNEAVIPTTLSGSAGDVKDYIRIVNADSAAKAAGQACSHDADCMSFKCSGGTCNGNNNYLEGKFYISNQYKTVEFISNISCGVNACGETIYCLPENSHLKVELKASGLNNCQPDNCTARSPFSSCQDSVCVDSSGHRYPQGVVPPNGVADAAMNSLDGNRDGYAYGPATYYNENDPQTNSGDNYVWSFYISDKIDLSAPQITGTDAAHNQQRVDAKKGVYVDFSKVMMSSSLTSGSIVINNGKSDFIHKLMNLWNFTNEPIGYWITSENRETGAPDQEPDWTQSQIRHTSFAVPAKYRSQAGSGVKDIYQNCFRPCAGPACVGESASQPSCCSGQTKAEGSCAQ